MKKHWFWIGELIIWLLVLFLISGTLTVARHYYKGSYNTYQFFLPDVDGLIEGSPVRIMGIPVGYVNQVNIVGEEVYVKFIVTEKNMKIPRGSVVTVEASGLGGSKSLELYPPNAKAHLPSENFLIAQTPKRIADSLGLLDEMYNKFMGIAYKISYFMGEVGVIKKEKTLKSSHKQHSAESFLDASDKWLDRTQRNCDEFKKLFTKNRKSDGKDGIIELEEIIETKDSKGVENVTDIERIEEIKGQKGVSVEQR